MALQDLRVPTLGQAMRPNIWDVVALILVIGAMFLIVYGGEQTAAPLSALDITPVSLDPGNLPLYALRTTLRMLLAIVCSIVFTFVYAALAAKSRRAEMVLIPLLDILQSVPILGFLTFTVVFFLNLFPGRVFGAELACVFAIFTSQAWNMTFSMYQSIRNVPKDLEEASQSFHLSGWQRFWRLDVPFAMPGLIWNTMMSMSGGWFFVVASEAITVGDTTIALPGVGSYIAKANDEGNWWAIGAAVLTMGIVILLYDQLLFRPIVAWAAKFRVELSESQDVESSWMLNLIKRTYWLKSGFVPIAAAMRSVSFWPLHLPRSASAPSLSKSQVPSRLIDALWILIVIAVAAWAAWLTVSYIATGANWDEVAHVFLLTTYTLIRVIVLMALATVVWVPISVWVGLRPRWAEAIQPISQFLAAFPVNLLFGAAVSLVLAFNLNPNIWLSFLIVFGTQWYIVFNTIGGAAAFPNDLREAAANFHVHGWLWWRQVIIPGIMPYYITGAITASGGSWNASIVAEYVQCKDHTATGDGGGASIAQATDKGDFPKIVLGVAVMSLFVTIFNRLFWRRLYAYAERRLRL